jgi:son of sevenless-like protein
MMHQVSLLHWGSSRIHSEPPLDTKYNKTFLMTYKSFSTTNELFDLLAARFWIQPPDNLTPAELDEWKRLKQHVVRARLVPPRNTS